VRCFVVLQLHIANFIVWCFQFTRRSTRFPMPRHLYTDLGGADSRWRDVGAQRSKDDFDDGMDEREEEEAYDYMKYGMISGTQENPRWEFGLNVEVMQGIYPPLQDSKHHAATREMLCRTAKWLQDLHLDCYGLWEQERRNKVGIRIALTNVGYKAIALGLNALLHGTETPNYHLDTIAVVAKAMETVDCKNMAHWILALSMGMELQNGGPGMAWRLFLPPTSPPSAPPAVSHDDATSVDEGSVDSDETEPMSPFPDGRAPTAMILQDVEPEEVPSACPGSWSY
jgi:hypothetical protein